MIGIGPYVRVPSNKCVYTVNGPLVTAYVKGKGGKLRKAAYSQCGWGLHGGLQHLVYDVFYDTSINKKWWLAPFAPSLSFTRRRRVYVHTDIFKQKDQLQAIRDALGPHADIVEWDGTNETQLKENNVIVKHLKETDPKPTHVYSIGVTRHNFHAAIPSDAQVSAPVVPVLQQLQ